MPVNITGTGNTFNLPNFAGDLFTASPMQTPFLSMIGGLSGGMKTENDEFPTGQLYEFPNEAITITYAKMANRGKLSGLNTAGQAANPTSELDWQVAQRLKKIARDVEFTFLNGTFNKATASNQANKTRGMFELCSTGTTIAAGNAAISVDLLKQLFKAMADAGAMFGNMVLFCGSDQKQRITALYEKQLGYNTPASRNIGGMNITELETDFFKMGVAYNPFVPNDRILIADVSACAPVFQDVPGKGTLFLEDLAKTGAAEKKQIYGEIGLDHGPAFLHGSITGLDYTGRE